MNWGGFAGGFAQGLNQTFDVKGISRYLMSPEYRQAKIMEEANAEAKAAQGAPTMADTAQSGGITGGETPKAQAPEVKPVAPVETAPVAATTPSNPAPMAGEGAKAIAASEQPAITKPADAPAQPATQQAIAQTGGLAGTQQEPAKAAQQPAKSPAAVEDFLYAKVLPIARNKFIQAGDLEGAERLDKHMESAKGKAAMTLYGKAYNALTYGNDVNKAVQLFGEYYNKFVDDGVDFTKGEITKDGQIAITTKNKSDGKEGNLTMSRGQLLRMGMAYNPVKLYEMNLGEAVEAEKAGAKTRAEIAKEDRKFNQDIEKMTIEKQLDAANVTTGERRKLDAKIGALRTAGYSDEFINGALPGLLGIGDYKKSTSPEEARRLAHSDRMKNDPVYARKPAAEQSKVLDQDMSIIYAGGKPTSTPAAPANPAAGGLPNSGKGTPVYDTKTNSIVYR